MPFRVIQPPSDQEQFTAEGKRLFAAAIGLGIPLEPEGFLYSWVNGTRVLVEETAEGEIIGFLLLTVASAGPTTIRQPPCWPLKRTAISTG